MPRRTSLHPTLPALGDHCRFMYVPCQSLAVEEGRVVKLYVGTSGYSYKEWRSVFYPEDLPATAMLRFYAEVFDSVEINSSFYRMPNPDTLKEWASQVPPRFRFVLKAPQRITHFQRLKRTDDSLSYLLRTADNLGDKLGALLFQTPPDFKCDLERLRRFLQMLPENCRAAFEFRHESWFVDDVFQLLRKHKAAFCVAQAETGLPVQRVATADWGYLRLRRLNYSNEDLSDWVRWILKQTWRETFAFFKHEDEGKAPQFASAFLEHANTEVRRQRQPGTMFAQL